MNTKIRYKKQWEEIKSDFLGTDIQNKINLFECIFIGKRSEIVK